MLSFLLKGVRRDRSRSLFPLIVIIIGVGYAVFAIGFLVGMLKRYDPQVTNRVFRSSPPNVQLVIVSSGVSLKASNFPSGEMTCIPGRVSSVSEDPLLL